jgi:hypothetical protein
MTRLPIPAPCKGYGHVSRPRHVEKGRVASFFGEADDWVASLHRLSSSVEEESGRQDGGGVGGNPHPAIGRRTFCARGAPGSRSSGPGEVASGPFPAVTGIVRSGPPRPSPATTAVSSDSCRTASTILLNFGIRTLPQRHSQPFGLIVSGDDHRHEPIITTQPEIKKGRDPPGTRHRLGKDRRFRLAFTNS